MHEPNYQTDYLGWFIKTEALRQSVKIAAEILRGLEFDAIAFRGMSGAVIAPALALELNKTMLMVRKPTYDSAGVRNHHSRMELEGDLAARKYVIVDDFIYTGTTVVAIVEKIRQVIGPHCKCLGVLEVDQVMKSVIKPELTKIQLFKKPSGVVWLKKTRPYKSLEDEMDAIENYPGGLEEIPF